MKLEKTKGEMGLRGLLYGALLIKMCILCAISLSCFVVAFSHGSSEPRDSRLKQHAQVELLRLGRESKLPTRRMLLGPGSYPPRCTTKCGKCSPCQPVHVAIPPGSDVIMEYYPEAWRCKCRNRLYMP